MDKPGGVFERFIKDKANRIDLLVLAGLSIFAVIFAIRFVDFSTQPIEDAAILMRYAQHFANGFGIVWNIGEAPVDGATDFLFMIILGLLVKAGLTLEFATRLLGFSANILTVWLVYLASRRLFRAPVLVGVISAAYLVAGPGFFYVASYYGTTFFAFSACVSWYLALSLCQKEETHGSALAFAISALITALIRPEGVILTGLMLLTILWMKGIKGARLTISYFLAIFLLIGGSYFLWRWSYFGYPLPNPFYKKGGGRFYPRGLQVSLLYTVGLCLPILPAFIAGLFFRKTFRQTIGYLLPILGFACAFILLTNDMNVGGRFQYVLLPMALMVWWPLLGGLREHLKGFEWEALDRPKRGVLVTVVLMLAVGAMGYLYNATHLDYFRDGKYDVALILADYKDKGLSLATTEAGLLPLYSDWRTLDAWGLNDQWIAHNGRLTQAYLASFHPSVIMFHADFTPLAAPDPALMSADWLEMDATLKTYAEKNNFVLAAVFGDVPNDTNYYYVRPDFPESAEIIRRIRAMVYYSNRSGKPETNYAGR